MTFVPTEYENGEPLLVIWKQPYTHGGAPKDAIGWFTPDEAAPLLRMPPSHIVRMLNRKGQIDTPRYSAEWT